MCVLGVVCWVCMSVTVLMFAFCLGGCYVVTGLT